MDRLARAALLVAGVSGLALAWVMFDWLGDPWDHCDYPEECLGTWFPRSFATTQALWSIAVLTGAVGAYVAALLHRPRRTLVVLGLAWVVLFTSVAVTPAYSLGQPMTREQVEQNWFVWDSSAYVWLSVLVVGASVVLGWHALRRTEHG